MPPIVMITQISLEPTLSLDGSSLSDPIAVAEETLGSYLSEGWKIVTCVYIPSDNVLCYTLVLDEEEDES